MGKNEPEAESAADRLMREVEEMIASSYPGNSPYLGESIAFLNRTPVAGCESRSFTVVEPFEIESDIWAIKGARGEELVQIPTHVPRKFEAGSRISLHSVFNLLPDDGIGHAWVDDEFKTAYPDGTISYLVEHGKLLPDEDDIWLSRN